MHEPPDLVTQAFGMSEAVAGFVERARAFFYAVMLFGHACPQCDGQLVMIQEGACRCLNCEHRLDPTVAFQRCPDCGSEPTLAVRRYRCRECDADVPPRFLFDGLVFDAEYFRQKMAESRERKHELREQVRQMLAESRSGLADLPAADLAAVPELMEALNSLVQTTTAATAWRPREGFDLNRYQAHIQAHLGPFAISLEQIPPLGEDRRKDRIWRFIAIIFLAHAGIVEVWQDGLTIMVMKREVDTEGQGVPRDVEDADGIEGSLGGAEA